MQVIHIQASLIVHGLRSLPATSASYLWRMACTSIMNPALLAFFLRRINKLEPQVRNLFCTLFALGSRQAVMKLAR